MLQKEMSLSSYYPLTVWGEYTVGWQGKGQRVIAAGRGDSVCVCQAWAQIHVFDYLLFSVYRILVLFTQIKYKYRTNILMCPESTTSTINSLHFESISNYIISNTKQTWLKCMVVFKYLFTKYMQILSKVISKYIPILNYLCFRNKMTKCLHPNVFEIP